MSKPGRKKEIIMKTLFTIILFLFISLSVFADSYHHAHEKIETSNINSTALSIATAQHHFDFGTRSLQGSFGVGKFDDNNAVSFGMAKQFNRVLINGTIGAHGEDMDLESVAFGAGVNWRF